jgi:hypothetical protein
MGVKKKLPFLEISINNIFKRVIKPESGLRFLLSQGAQVAVKMSSLHASSLPVGSLYPAFRLGVTGELPGSYLGVY